MDGAWDEHERLRPGVGPGWGMSWWFAEQGITRADRAAMTSEQCLAQVMRYWRAVGDGWCPLLHRSGARSANRDAGAAGTRARWATGSARSRPYDANGTTPAVPFRQPAGDPVRRACSPGERAARRSAAGPPGAPGGGGAPPRAGRA